MLIIMFVIMSKILEKKGTSLLRMMVKLQL